MFILTNDLRFHLKIDVLKNGNNQLKIFKRTGMYGEFYNFHEKAQETQSETCVTNDKTLRNNEYCLKTNLN